MVETIVSAFREFPKQSQAIGHLLASYATLELEMCHCVSVALDDFDMVFKAMFRPRGESQRVGVADALGRKRYRELRLGTPFDDAITGMKHCLKIRNQFAHCQWHNDLTGDLGFVNLENLAKRTQPINDLGDAKTIHLSLPFLRQCEAYFVYVYKCFRFLNFEGRKRAGKLPSHRFLMPKKEKPPNPCNP